MWPCITREEGILPGQWERRAESLSQPSGMALQLLTEATRVQPWGQQGPPQWLAKKRQPGLARVNWDNWPICRWPLKDSGQQSKSQCSGDTAMPGPIWWMNDAWQQKTLEKDVLVISTWWHLYSRILFFHIYNRHWTNILGTELEVGIFLALRELIVKQKGSKHRISKRT